MNPRPVRQDRKPLVVRAIVVLAILVSTTLTTTTAPASRSPDADAADPVARGRLWSLLPPGYPSEACRLAALPRAALAKLSCEKNFARAGPLSSTYVLVRDKAASGATFELKQVRRRCNAS